ncbi:O-antigen ligase family protein [Candidatus Pelagibacter sp.]|nr:O-antigen ligase family protein [Candidatus Pelagibacter sp.]
MKLGKQLFNIIIILLFSFFPISFILGNPLINLNIVLINILFLYNCYKFNSWEWLKDRFFRLLLIFYFYIIINSIFFHYLTDYSNYAGLLRSFSFIKFIFLAYSFRQLVENKKILDKIIKNWLVIISIIIVDVLFERIFGNNILGNISPDATRIVSFFDDELVVGGLILCFGFLIATYFLNKNLEFKSKIFFNVFLFFVPFSVFITGERSNFIKSFIIFTIIIILIDKTKLIINKKIFLILLISALFTSIFFSENIRIKQTEVLNRLFIVKDVNNFLDKFQNIKYFSHYDVAVKIFKDFPVSGVSGKNFRNFCHEKKYFNKNIKFSNSRCSTHPHQIHFELLSEHGLVGYLFLSYLFFIFFKRKLIEANSSNNIFQYASIIYLIVFFTPLLPGGAMFSTFNGALFWIVFSVANLNFNKKLY